MAQIIRAPSRLQTAYPQSVFLAGTTSLTGGLDWRAELCKALAGHAVTIFNPKREDWDSTWREDLSDKRWAEQIQWELDRQEEADIVVVLLHGVTAAPISLAELGMASRTGKLIACATDGYSKQGYVEAICRRYKAPFVRTEEDLTGEVLARLRSLGEGA